MTWAQVATEAKVTVETLRAIRRGKNEPSALTKRGLEQALQWQTGSVDQVYAGRDPLPLPQSEDKSDQRQPPIDLDSYVPQTSMELVIKQLFQAQRAEREELQRKLQEIDEKLNRLTGNSGHDDGEARTA